jgi:catechol 2,3-dioxygenase-like lactoylglutathione lyase family enzyme
MKRLHVHVAVDDLEKSIGFYAHLFGADPTIRHDDYAKWMLDDPRVNFAISTRGRAPGLDHLGIQVDSRDELDHLVGALHQAELSVRPQENASCCYAKSDKGWVSDPTGIRWETFYTHGTITDYGGTDPDHAFAKIEIPAKVDSPAAGACCGPAKAQG